MAVAVEQERRKSGWERAVAKFGALFEEQGLGAADISAAILAHEVIGMVMAAGFWTACYTVQPSKTVARPLANIAARSRRGARLQAAYSTALLRATGTVMNMGWLRKASGDPARLTVSLAESLCLRAAIKPLTFPFKLWAAYQVVVFGKQWKRGNGGGVQAALAEVAGGERVGWPGRQKK